MAEITDLLNAASNGDEIAGAKAFAALETELRNIAQIRLARFSAPDPDRPRLISVTELVEKAFEKTVRQTVNEQQAEWWHRGQFVRFVATKIGRLLLDELRKKRKTFSLEQVGEVPGKSQDPSDLAVAEEALRKLDECVERLSEELKLVVQYYFYLEMKEREIAELFHIAVSTVSKRKSEAIQQLRECLQDSGFDLD